MLLLEFLFLAFAFLFITQVILPAIFSERLKYFWLFRGSDKKEVPHGLSDLEAKVNETIQIKDKAQEAVAETLEQVKATKEKTESLEKQLK